MTGSEFKFLRRVRIHDGECGAVARALHHVVKRVGLSRNEQLFNSMKGVHLYRADQKKVFRSTIERKIMSKKTSFKRIALIAVSALTFGLVSGIAPASAAASITLANFITTDSDPSAISYKELGTTDVTIGSIGRYGVVNPVILASKAEIGVATELAIKFTTLPTGATYFDKNTAYYAGTDAALLFASGNGVTGYTLNSSVDGNNVAILIDTVGEGDIETGVYKYTVWADTDADGLQDSGEASATGQITIGGAPATTTVSFSANPLLAGEPTFASFSFKDEDGFATILATDGYIDDAGGDETFLTAGNLAGETETIEIEATAAFSDEGIVDPADMRLLSNGQHRITLTGDDAGAYKTIVVNSYDDTGGAVITADLSKAVAITVIDLGVVSKSAVLSSASTDSDAYSVAFDPADDTTGSVTINTSLATVYVTVTTDAAGDYFAYSLTSGTAGMDITEVDTKPLKSGTNKTSTITITNTTPVDGETADLVIEDSSGFSTTWTLTWADPLPEITVSPSADLSAVKGSTLSWAISVSDQFGGAVTGVLTATVTGRNQKASTLTVTGGSATYSLTDSDAAIVTGTNDTDSVVFKFVDTDANEASDTIAITWSATAPAVATVDVTVSDATPDIDTTELLGKVDADSISAVTATLTNASGVRLGAGITVNFSQADTYFGLVDTFSRMTLGSGSAITNALGEATIYSYSRKAGGRQISATVGGKSGLSEKVTWSNAGGDARYVALTADLDKTVGGGFIRYTATVTDRWGNPVAGEDVTLSESGVGRFAAGSDTNPDTNVLGQVSIDLTSSATETGNGVVTATLTTANQTTDLAGFVGGVATAGVTAGVRSASKTIEFTKDTSTSTSDALLELAKAIGTGNSADAAADAALEAIDAANAATDAANLAAEAADAATVAAEEARDAADAATAAVEALSAEVATLVAALKAQITTLANTVAKIAKKVKA